jgi:hypothetical protein
MVFTARWGKPPELSLARTTKLLAPLLVIAALLIEPVSNTTSCYSGRHLIDAMDGSSTGTLTVKATGSWKITVASGLASAKRGDTSITGQGGPVVLTSSESAPSDCSTVFLEHLGHSNVTMAGPSSFLIVTTSSPLPE